MDHSKVPPHLVENLFRRYEKVIAQLLKQWPTPLALDPQPFAPATYSSRLRDAMRSLLTYKWPTSIDVELLKALRPKMVVRVEGGAVIVGPKGTALDQQALEPQINATLSTKMSKLVAVSWLILLHEQEVSNPITIRGWKEEAVRQLAAHVEVHILGLNVGELNITVFTENGQTLVL